jgi:hypothetical protein
VSRCPRCGAQITERYEVGPAAPKPGGFTICWQCDEFLRFGPDLTLRQLTDDDKRTIDMNPQTARELDQLRIQTAIARKRG